MHQFRTVIYSSLFGTSPFEGPQSQNRPESFKKSSGTQPERSLLRGQVRRMADEKRFVIYSVLPDLLLVFICSRQPSGSVKILLEIPQDKCDASGIRYRGLQAPP